MRGYPYRYWEGEPTKNDGITHAVDCDIDLDYVAACGYVTDENDFRVHDDQLVTCLRCWARMMGRGRVRR